MVKGNWKAQAYWKDEWVFECCNHCGKGSFYPSRGNSLPWKICHCPRFLSPAFFVQSTLLSSKIFL